MQNSPRFQGLSGFIAVLGVLVLLAGLIVMALLPEIRFAAWGVLIIGALLLVTAFVMEFRRVGRALSGRRGVFGIGSTVMASIFIGITLLINAISIGSFYRFDLTGVAQFTLTSQTQDVLKELETPVKAISFSVLGDPLGSYINDLLSEYQNHSDQLTLKTIDPDQQPDLARQYGISQYPAVVFETDEHYRLVNPTDIIEQVGQDFSFEAEHPFTSAILEVSGIIQKKVYFITGHGETDIRRDYSFARDSLRDNLYKVDTLDLRDSLSIPQDAAALIIVAPRFSIVEDEIDVIQNYLKNGGQLLLLTNPNPPEWINQLLYPWGVEIEEGTVIDTTSYIPPNRDMPLVEGARMVEGLRLLYPPLSFYFPGITAIIPFQEETEGSPAIQPLVWTSQQSWLERDYTPDEEYEFNEETDREGPLALGVLIVDLPADSSSPESAKLTRLAVIGDSDFAANEHFNNGNNGYLFLSSVSWLTEETEIISIHRKALPFRRLVVSPQEERFINYSAIGLVPLLVLIAGVIIWTRRR